MMWNGLMLYGDRRSDRRQTVPLSTTQDHGPENGLDDPAELFEKGKWDWDTFLRDMLSEFVDTPNEHYGIDSWYFESGLQYHLCSVHPGLKTLASW